MFAFSMILPAKPSKGGDQSMNMQNSTLQEKFIKRLKDNLVS